MQIKYIVATSVVLGCILFAVMTLVARFLLHKHSKRPLSDVNADEAGNEQKDQLSKISNSWKRMFMPREKQVKGRWVPSISNVLKAGDEGIISSILLDKLSDHSGELTLEALYEILADELRARPFIERTSYSGNVPKFLSSTKHAAQSPRRTQSVSQAVGRGRGNASLKHRKSVEFSVTEWGSSRNMSVRRPPPVLVPMSHSFLATKGGDNKSSSWDEGGQVFQGPNPNAVITITPAELAALSIVLGLPLRSDQKDGKTALSKGAFGISMSMTAAQDGKTQVLFHKNRRILSEATSRKSGHSLLFAKHIAAGSLPFMLDSSSVKSILITNHTFQALKRGENLTLHQSSFTTPQAKYLATLPHHHQLQFHVLSSSPQGQSLNTLLEAVAALPFTGGLTPLTSIPLLKTVRFIAAGGLPPSRILQRLEDLVHKVNQHSSSLSIFGPLYEPRHGVLQYRERERLGKLASDPSITDSLANKVSRMQRYVTLLQRLMALVPDMKQQDVLIAVQHALRSELENSYSESVAVYRVSGSQASFIADSHGSLPSDARSKRHSMPARMNDPRSNRTSIYSTASPSGSAGSEADSLSKQVENVLKAELPLNVETIAFVARTVLVAWTLSVEQVAWDEDEEGFKVPDLQKLPGELILC